MGNRSRGDVVADLGEQGKGPSQGRRRLQKTERDGGTASPPGPLEGRQPCSHLDFSPARPLLDSASRTVHNVYCLKALSCGKRKLIQYVG